MGKDFLTEILKVIEEGKTSFDASREQAKDRRINEENDDPIMFVFPEQKDLPEHMRGHVANIAGVMKDLFGNITPDSGKSVSDKPEDNKPEDTPFDDDKSVTEHVSSDVTDESERDNTPFVLVDGSDKMTLLISAVGFSEDDISIQFIDGELVVKTYRRSRPIRVSSPSVIAGSIKDVLGMVDVRLFMPDVVQEKTTFDLSGGLLTINFVKETNKENVYVVK